MMERTENRKHGRVPVSFRVSRFINTMRVDAEAVDLSCDGFRIIAGAASRVGSQYTLVFKLPATWETMRAGVEVAHRTNGYEGLRIVNMEPKHQERFRQWVAVELAGHWFRA